jgi:hypothetical protein
MTSYERFKKWKAGIGADAWRAYCRARYHKHPEKVLIRNRRWFAKQDPEARKARNRAAQVRYWDKHGDVIRARRRKRFASNPKVRTQVQEWKKANPDRVKVLRNKGNGIRRARERAATIGDLIDIHKIYERCNWWKQWFDVVVDHAISLARGGTHEAKNLQIIYRFENEKKGARLDYKPRVIFT